MAEKKLNEIIIHCHFDGEPSPELIEALNRMADLAAKNLGKEINNGDTEKRGSKLRCPTCNKQMRQDNEGDWIITCDCEFRKQFT